MTVALVQECKRFLMAIPFAGTCSQCGMAARWWPELNTWAHAYKVDQDWCFPSPDRHFVEIEPF